MRLLLDTHLLLWAISDDDRGEMPLSGREALGYSRSAGYELLSIAPEHAVGVEQLPPIHADPFDRLLVAQALAEPLRLITHDKVLGSYSDAVVVV